MKKPCGCCSGIVVVTPEPEYNRPGLPSISYRAGTYSTFLESMLARLSTVYIDVSADGGTGASSRLYPLKRLTTRELSDPSIALLDAWAVVADVLTFYQERIANEGYLGTATERVSVLELARLIGYKPRPGVAASVFLAFTASNGFKGEIPAGTRAQSIPGAGQTAQYFETSAKLPIRDTWNSLGPRLTRPQVISPPPPSELKLDNHLGTNADVLDSIYFRGIATNLKVNDALLLVASQDPNQQFLRFAERVDPQADQSRTLVALRVNAVTGLGALDQRVNILKLYIDAAPDQFPGSDLAAGTASLLQGILDKEASGPADAAAFARGVVPQVQAFHDVAVKRQFTRVEVWLQHLLDVLPVVVRVLEGLALRAGQRPVARPSFGASALEHLGVLLPSLTLARSVQPANPLRLTRSIAASFASHSDMMPRLIGALNPIAAPIIYNAWGGVQPVHVDLEIYAARAKAALFASSFAGFSSFDGNKTVFIPAKISNAWGDLVSQGDTALSVIALDSVYDKIAVDTWVAVSQPNLAATNPLAARHITFHQVLEVQTVTLDTTTGYTSKVTLLTLDSNWLTGDARTTFQTLIDSPLLLRGTVVYAQAEPLDLAEEPLDRDVEGDSIELDGLYDGLEPGKWIVVSGERTDIPNAAGVNASELAMISAVTQGAGKQACVPFLPRFVPFESLFYISDQNADGDRLVVGLPANGLPDLLKQLPDPATLNQQFCEPVLLSPGIYANAYIPSKEEKAGSFGAFPTQLIDPVTNLPFPAGVIPANRIDRIFAWRIRSLTSGSETVHTTIQLASGLAYKYNSTGITLYANVAKATHGQTTGEILGNGDASQAFQNFALHQKPLTYLSAATPEGAQSTLSVSVNEIEWHETGDLAGLAPTDREYITQTDDNDQTTVIFGNGVHGTRVPTGSANLKATYRYGIGSPGNVDAGLISQLATHPGGLQGVINPLPSTGGADRDSLEQVRGNAPFAAMALDRLVSVQDYADFARTYAGIGKASATLISDGRRQLVHLTIAGAGDIPIDQNSDLYQNFVFSLQRFGDPFQRVQVCVRKVRLLVISAGVQLRPDYDWEAVEPQIRAAVLAVFNFDERDLGQPAFLSEVIAAIQAVEGVLFSDARVFDSVSEDTTVDELAKLAATLKLNPYVAASLARLDPAADPAGDPCARIRAAELVFLTPDIPETLILTNIGA
jgi:hypothetical protein